MTLYEKAEYIARTFGLALDRQIGSGDNVILIDPFGYIQMQEMNGRIYITGGYKKDVEGNRLYYVDLPTITVSAKKDAIAIAVDMERRFMAAWEEGKKAASEENTRRETEQKARAEFVKRAQEIEPAIRQRLGDSRSLYIPQYGEIRIYNCKCVIPNLTMPYTTALRIFKILKEEQGV
jgi:hypothetical protein